MTTWSDDWLYGSIYTTAGSRIGPVVFSPLLKVFRLAHTGHPVHNGVLTVGERIILYRMGSNRDEGGVVQKIEQSGLDGMTRFYFQ